MHTANENINLLIYCMSTRSTSGLVLPLTFSFNSSIVAMADVNDSFYAKTWSNWKEFRDDFEQYCKDTHQVFATLDSRTVDKQNTRLSVDTVKYSADLKYAYMRFGCIHYGKKYTPKCRNVKGERPVQR